MKIENLCGAVSTADQDAVAVIEERGGQDRAGLEQKVRLALETRPGGDLITRKHTRAFKNVGSSPRLVPSDSDELAHHLDLNRILAPVGATKQGASFTKIRPTRK